MLERTLEDTFKFQEYSKTKNVDEASNMPTMNESNRFQFDSSLEERNRLAQGTRVKIGSKSLGQSALLEQPKENLGKNFEFIFESKRRKPNELLLKLGKQKLSYPGRQDISGRILKSLKREAKAFSDAMSPEMEEGKISKIIE